MIKTIETSNSKLYVYRKKKEEFVFKPTKDFKKEMIVNKLAKLFNIKTLDVEFLRIKNLDW